MLSGALNAAASHTAGDGLVKIIKDFGFLFIIHHKTPLVIKRAFSNAASFFHVGVIKNKIGAAVIDCPTGVIN